MLMYGAACWTIRHEDETLLLASEMEWLWRIAGISRRERKRNEDIRKLLGNRETIQKSWTRD